MNVLAELQTGGTAPHVVMNVLDASLRQSLLDRLTTLTPTPLDAPGTPLHGVGQWGCMSGPSPKHPRGPAPERYRSRNLALWAKLAPLSTQIERQVTAAIAGLTDCPVSIAPTRAIGSIRRMAGGCGAPAHLDRYPPSAITDEVRDDVDQEQQLVWYVMLSRSPAGGVLRTYPGRCVPDTPPDAAAAYQEFDVPNGALLIHAAARHWHSVTAPIGGARITLGGLCLPHRTGDHYWLCA